MIPKTKYNDSSIAFRLPKSLKQKFRERCESQNVHYQTVLRKLMEDYVAQPIKEDEQRRYNEYLKIEKLL